MEPVRIFLGLDGDLNPNAQMFTLKLLNKVKLDNPHQKIIAVTDNPYLGNFIQKQTGMTVSDFVEGEFERALLITDKEEGDVDLDAEGNPKYDFDPKVIRIFNGLVKPDAPMTRRPDSLPKPEEPKKPFNWADHYSDFVDYMKRPVQYIPTTLDPDIPMPRTWTVDLEGM